jgi:hypothetical protein
MDSSTLLTAGSDEDGDLLREPHPSRRVADTPSKATSARREVSRDASMEEDGPVLQEVAAMEEVEVPRGHRSKMVAVGPTRRSARFTGSEASVPVMQRPLERAANKNLDGPGKQIDSDFTVLPLVSNSHLLEVAHDSGLAFTVESGLALEAISLIQAKEEAQAALALAAYRRSLARPEEGS